MLNGGSQRQLRRTAKGPLVLLFYDGFELKAAPGLAGSAYSRARGVARYAWRRLKRTQGHTGFYAAFLALRRSLAAVGCDVRVNDFATARAMPDYPIGIAGYPSVLDKVDLPNPMIFGPGDVGPPEAAPVVAQRRNVRIITQPGPWICDHYKAVGAVKTEAMFVGIDTAHWPDWSREPKPIDVLVYDKIRWHRERLVGEVLDRHLGDLKRRGLSYQLLRYGAHHVTEFRHWLKRSRVLSFLCEHETQGLAYQEAMSTNAPVFAWDEGKLIDPSMAQHGDIQVSAVPYFDERCGVRFKLPEMETAFADFWERRDSFSPRSYVQDALSLQRSGENYLRLYASLV
jgi:hypothetical protein